MRAKFNGITYRVDTEPISGYCTPPTGSCSETIGITDGVKNTEKSLIAIIHEFRHAGNFDTKEEKVDRVSRDIGRALWRMGWRYHPPRKSR